MTEHGGKSARTRILQTAAELFYRDGIRCVGVDRIIAQSGVAKMSLYRHFASKDDLVVAFLQEADRHYWEWWDRVTARHPGQPRAQLRALFAALGKWVTHSAYRGCPFINTAVEFRDPAYPGRGVVQAHTEEVRRRFRDLAESAGAQDPDRLAEHLLLLMEGTYAVGAGLGADVAVAVTGAADALIVASCGPE